MISVEAVSKKIQTPKISKSFLKRNIKFSGGEVILSKELKEIKKIREKLSEKSDYNQLSFAILSLS